MSFSKYPDYKHSGVEWLGCLPNHWEVAPVARHYFLRNGYPFNAERFSPDGVKGDRLIRIRDILGNQSHLYTDEACPDNAIVENGDVLVGMDGDFNVVVWNEGNAKLNQRVCAIRGRTEPWDGFFYYAINAPLKVINDLTFSTTVKHLSSTQVMKLRFPVPPTQELEQIVTFLDHETAKIDTLIHEQKRLIELLQEKRQAVISHAVTKGLNLNVPMKNSGVEWLGEVPAHWDRTLVKHCCFINDGNHGEEYPKGEDFTDDSERGVPFIRGGNLENMTVTTDGMLYITAKKNKSMRKGRLEVGDILFVNRGEIGKLAVVPPSMDGANLNSQIAYLRVIKNFIQPNYLLLYLSSDTIKAEVEAASEGSVLTQYPISYLESINVPVPPLKEQNQISEYLNTQLRSFNILISGCLSGMKLLTERRSALISAAVTGKIDVRNWQPPADESAFDEEIRQAGMEATV
jgi:type I restriction enzyme S subunit